MQDYVQFTKFTSPTIVTKTIELVDEKICKSANVLSEGTARRMEVTFEEFYKMLINATPYQAFGYGVSDYKKIGIVSRKSGLADGKKFITRSKDNFYYPQGNGILLLDYDYSSDCPFADDLSINKFLEILDGIIPTFGGCAKIIRESVSAGVHKEGEKKEEYKKGFHVYIPVKDATDITRFGKLLHEYLWAHGYGYIKVSKSGSLLNRSIVDVAVFSPERIEFIGEPYVIEPLCYDKPWHKYIKGHFLDTTLLRKEGLDTDRVDDNYKREEKRTKRIREERIKDYDYKKCLEHIDNGFNAKEAEELVKFNRNHDYSIIDTRTLLYFDNGETLTAEDAINKKLFKQYCACPIKGPEYGTQKAMLLHTNGRFFIRSYAFQQKIFIKENKTHSIRFINANPGCGKSYNIVQIIIDMETNNKKVCLALPTKDLMEEYNNNLKKVSKYKKRMVIAEGNDASVNKQISLALQDNVNVLIITHACLRQLPKSLIKRLSDFYLIIDEAFDPLVSCKQYSFKNCINEGGLLKELCDWKPMQFKPNVYTLSLKAGKKKSAKEQLKERDDKNSITNEETNELISALLDPTKCVIVSKMKTSENYCIGIFYNCNNLSLFKSTLVASAFLTHTLLYHWLDQHYNLINVTKKFEDSFVNLNHRIKKLVLLPLFEKYSKHVRGSITIVNKKDKTEYSVQRLVNWIINHSKYLDSNILRVMNKDDYYPNTNLLLNGEDTIVGNNISSFSHGLNKYKDINCAALVAAFNLHSYQVHFLKNVMPSYNSWVGSNVLTFIQCMMRTSLRDYDSDQTVFVIVPDQPTAEKIKELYSDLPKIVDMKLKKYFSFSMSTDI